MCISKIFLGVLFILSLVILGCQNGSNAVNALEATNGISGDNSFEKVGRTEVWADCELFGSVVTPATFNPQSDPFDELYAASFKDGIGLISESKPGDQDYNGGRWHMNVLKAGVDPNKYDNACRVEDLDLNDFQSAGNYFECPLLPRRGRGNN
jgi:hypothetical protein